MRYKKVSALLLGAAVLSSVMTETVSANSAQTSWQGIYGTGAIAAEKNSPLIVEEELLTFDISEFPQEHYEKETDYLAYSGMVTARYTFFNPADYTVKAKLLFPFGTPPTYAFQAFDEEGKIRLRADDTSKFEIKVEGQKIERTLRHTFFDSYGQFELGRDIALLHDGFARDEFYSPNLPVTRYTYIVSDIDKEKYPAANLALDVPRFDGTRKVLLAEQSGAKLQEGGGGRISAWADNGVPVTLYTIGAPFSQEPKWKFYRDGGTKDGEEIEGTMTLTETTKLTFKDLAFMAYNPKNTVSESDWYNAILTAFKRDDLGNAGFIVLKERSGQGFDISDSLMRWYEYEISLEPGKRLINTVQAPLYPSIDMTYEPAIYGYTYLTSPARTWASLKRLEIVVNTPYFMKESNPPGFTKSELGYSLTLNEIPEGELSFTLSSVESPQNKRGSYPSKQNGLSALIATEILLGVGILVFILLWQRKRHRKNSR